MQRSNMSEATFITTNASMRVLRGAASIVAVALVGTTPWMVSQSTLAQDAPASEPAPAQDDAAKAAAEAAAKAAAEQAAAEAAAKAAAEKAAAEAAAKAAAIDANRASAREAMSRSEWKKSMDLWSAVLAAAPGDAEASMASA